MITDCYTTLGLKKDATRTEILAAFRAKSKDCHPDQGGNPEEFRKLLAAKNAALAALEYAEFFQDEPKGKEEEPIGKIMGKTEPPQKADIRPQGHDRPVRSRRRGPLMLGAGAFGAGALAAFLWGVTHFDRAGDAERAQGTAPQNAAQAWQSHGSTKVLISFK